jgi:glutamate-ammonia-ligase adenylyltransferase
MPTPDHRPVQALLTAAAATSRYLKHALDHPPPCFDPACLSRPLSAQDIRALLDAGPAQDEAALASRLRQVRKAVMMHVIARDLGGLADLNEVMQTMTALAEECVRFALRHLDPWLTQAHGPPLGGQSGRAQSLLVVAMGKLGGGELNVSSDIDLIFLYAEEGRTEGPRIVSNHEYFTRLGRRLINALGEFTSEGYVFRVDMRLRPYGDSGPLAMSLEMLENYLHTQGREWERYAWVKAREITGQAVDELTALVTPFVYRRHLDFSAIASLRELHGQIRAEVKRRDLHDDIKLGPGGIREIEFVTQVFQIVRGGHDAGLRLRPTLATLACLAQRQLLPADAVEQLSAAYVFLRNLEHRLQYLDDQQTQMLPAGAGDLAAVARAMGFPEATQLRAELERHRACVTRHFEAVFAGAAGNGEHPLEGLWTGTIAGDEAQTRLRALGYEDPARVLERLHDLRAGAAYRRMSASTQARVDKLVPRLLELAAQFEHPGTTLERLARVLQSIGRRESYLALLLEYPGALGRLAALAAASPWAADYLAQHPVLLDELISQEAFEAPDRTSLAAQLRQELDEAAGNTERQMDLLRHFKQVQTLRLLSQDLAGTLPLETLSDHLSDLACLILGAVLRLAWQGLRTRHCEQPRFTVVGYGKLGGKELGYASDLDLIFLYDDEHPDAADNYARLSQRINTWLTSFTPAGALYETDLRLRPDGASGMLVSRLDAFAEYQRSKAWVWEHQALTRARFVAGDPAIGTGFEQLRVAILRLPRALPALSAEIQEMRSRMLAGHPNTSGLFDIKHDRGGIVDVEFIVQYLVLGFAHRHAELTGNIGNLALLKLSGSLSLIPGSLATAVHHSYREFRRMQHALRLQGEQYARVPKERVGELVGPVIELWTEVFGGAERPAPAP